MHLLLIQNIEVLNSPGFGPGYARNYGIEKAQGEYVLLLNNDIEVITKDWLEQMLMYVQNDNGIWNYEYFLLDVNNK